MGHASAAVSAPLETIGGRYRIERLLGQGGMGAVHAVHGLATGKKLALKRIAHGASTSAAALFEREYHALAGLRHPCIVEVYEYERDEGSAFYTMELIEGVDLGKARHMPWREACRDLRDIASILGVLHARRLLHRDLSPRNMLRSPNGRLKLIDFGALASFGPCAQTIGTPPFVAPEALRTGELDQRCDLFSLGALAYWLLTGMHAYPARTLAELPYLWQQAPAPASELARLSGSADGEHVPAELDALIASLLRVDPAERLSNTAELIDRLNAIAGLEPELQEQAVQGYLASQAFVGRARECERALACLAQASSGTVQTLLVEGDAGIGRTRFLRELVVISRLQGALPLVAGSGSGARPYGVAETLLLALLHALPQQTRAVCAPYAGALSHISKELGAALGVHAWSSMPHAPAEARVRLLSALRDVLLALADERLLAVFIDDLQEIDEESRALLTTLAHAEAGPRLMIVAALARDAQVESAPVFANLRAQSTRIQLLPLSTSEMHELLRSVFGQAPYLSRLSERLHRASEGNPAYCLELAQHLVRTGAASYQEGAWSLPAELPPGSLPENRQATHVTRLERLSQEARELSRCLSIPHSTAFSDSQCCAVSSLPQERVSELLGELVRAGVLCTTADGHRFTHATVQAALYAELDEPGRRAVHVRLGAQLAEASERSVLDELRACAHFLRGGAATRAFASQKAVQRHFARGDMSALSRAAPLLEEVYTLHLARGRDKYAVVGLLGLLGIAGYFADRSYARRFGDLAIATMQDILCLRLARILSYVLGRKLGLTIALVVAGTMLRSKRDRAPSVKGVVQNLMSAAASLAGTAACCVDPDGVSRYAAVIEPFTVFGVDHAATLMHQSALNSLPHLRDRPALASETLALFIARLESPVPIRGLPDAARANYLAGAFSILGVVQSWRDTPECLQTADRLERFSPLYAMNADYLRYSYYAAQGDLKKAEHYRQRMEVHAVQLGSAWQVETWAPADAAKVALRTHDAGQLKRGVQELARLRNEVPSLVLAERLAHGTYLVLRRKYEQAIPLLETDDAPCSFVGWTRNRGILALAYNELGQHARAREICVDALSFRRPEDLPYVTLSLNVQIELAMAEAGLGNSATAKAQLNGLLAQHAPHASAITIGSLHHALARVALADRDLLAARAHAVELEARYRSTSVATLIETVEAFKRDLARAENPGASGDVPGEPTAHTLTRVQRLLSYQGSTLIDERANKSLQVALEFSSASVGFIVLADSGGTPAAHLGSAPSSDLVSWAEQSMLDAGVDEQTVMTEEVHSDLGSNYKVVGSMHYCVVPLWARQNYEEEVVAALVLGFDNSVPRLPDPTVVRAIAMHLMGTESVRAGRGALSTP